MSQDKLINIKLAKKNVDIVNLLKDLMIGGWNIICNNSIFYLPIEDNGEYDWQQKDIPIEAFFDMVRTKVINSEVIGVAITWRDTGVGGNLIIYPSLEISFLISINKKEINICNNRRIIDINWYIENLIILLKDKDYVIESFSYEEF